MTASTGTTAPTQQLSTPQLLQQLTDQTKTLVSQEIGLAKMELGSKVKKVGVGAGLLAGALVLVYFAVMVLLAAAVLGLATVVSGWLAALIVAAALILVAVGLALYGKAQISKGTPPAPAAAIESTKADVAAIKTAAGR